MCFLEYSAVHFYAGKVFMLLYEIFFIGVGLSMDAFAAAVCRGLSMKKINYRHALIIALFFGGFQALMPLVGWLLGTQFSSYIEQFDHWIAFGLLLFIGGKMIIDVIRGEDESCPYVDGLNLKQLTVMAIATSIDALAVGVSFAFLKTNIFSAIGVIGATTFVLSLVGVVIGNKFGEKYKNKATLAGGIILVAIGVKILLEHLGIINF